MADRGRRRRRRHGRGRGGGIGEASGPTISGGVAPRIEPSSRSRAEVEDSSEREPVAAPARGQLLTSAARPRSSPIGASVPANTIGAKRPGYGIGGTPVQILVNCFEMDVPVNMIHHYDVSIIPEDRVLPQKINMEIIRQMQDQNHSIFTKRGCFDGRKNLYSPIRYLLGDEAQFTVHDPIQPSRWHVRIKWVAIINPLSATHYIEGKKDSHDKSSQMTVNACNVAIRMQPIQGLPFDARRFFSRAEHRDVGRGVELWRGYFQSVRPMIERMVVNIDIGSAAFYKRGPLIRLCIEYLGENPSAHPVPLLSGNHLDAQTRKDLLKFIRNLKVQTTANGITRSAIRVIKDISNGGADTLCFLVDGVVTSVSTFFTQTTGRPLNYPSLICVQLSRTSWVPLECCEVLQGQFYRKTLSPDQTRHMDDFSRLRPDGRLQSILNGLQVLGYSNTPCLQEFGASVDPNPMTIAGRILPTPTLLYGKNTTVQPRNGRWNIKGKTLYEPAIVLGCAIIIYDGRFGEEAELRLKQSLFNTSRMLGIQGISPDPPIIRKDATGGQYWNHLREVGMMHKQVKGNMPNLIIVVLPDFGSEDIYLRIKNAGDIKIGIATQCLKAGKCVRASQNYWVNVCLKINAKLGGINFLLKPEIIPMLADPTVPSIVMGADVMHPGPSQLVRPSYSSVVGCIDSSNSRYIAISRAQTCRVERIEDLADMVAYIIRKFMQYRKEVEKDTNPAPRRIVFYRDGISEGQFTEFKQVEVSHIFSESRRFTFPVLLEG